MWPIDSHKISSFFSELFFIYSQTVLAIDEQIQFICEC